GLLPSRPVRTVPGPARTIAASAPMRHTASALRAAEVRWRQCWGGTHPALPPAVAVARSDLAAAAGWRTGKSPLRGRCGEALPVPGLPRSLDCGNVSSSAKARGAGSRLTVWTCTPDGTHDRPFQCARELPHRDRQSPRSTREAHQVEA